MRGLPAAVLALVLASFAGVTGCERPAGEDAESKAQALGVPYKVADIPSSTFQNAPLSNAQPVGALNGAVLLAAGDPLHGNELRTLPVASSNADLLVDLWPGNGPGMPYVQPPWAVLNGVGYFVGSDGRSGLQLFKTDGTLAGTRLVKRIGAGYFGIVTSPSPTPMVAAAGRIFFTARLAQTGVELWSSDGTEAGTTMVRDLTPGTQDSAFSSFTELGASLLFVNSAAGELWRSDGTNAGTARVKDLYLGSATSNPTLVRAGTIVFFAASDSTNGRELWKSDGTELGTTLVKDVEPGTSSGDPAFLAAAGSSVYFVAGGTGARQIWKSDGTANGTVAVTTNMTDPRDLVVAGAQLFFAAGNPGDRELHVLDSAGTASRVTDLYPGGSGYLGRMVSLGARVAFNGTPTNNSSGFVYVSDGTANGTVQLSSTPFNNYNPFGVATLSVHAGRLFFPVGNSSQQNLLVSDGTPAGTVPVSGPTFPTLISTARELVELNGAVIFSANAQLWRSDGTEAGTRPLTWQNQPFNLRRFDQAVYFKAGAANGGSNQLWRTDGTDAGTVQLSAAAGMLDVDPLGRVPGKVFFGGGSINSRNLWVYEEADGGAALVKDLNASAYFNPHPGVPVGDKFVFPMAGSVLVTDGTDAGTFALYSASIPSGALSYWSVNLGGFAYVGAESLVRTDGTPGGTTVLTDGYPRWLSVIGNTLYFVALKTGRFEIWKTDGTVSGTVRAIQMPPSGSANGDIDRMSAWGDKLVFVADDGVNGKQLFVSDGTQSGTVPISGAPFAMTSSSPTPFREALAAFRDGPVAFAGGTLAGNELWVSYGAAGPTFQVADLHPGIYSSNPDWLTLANGKLFFTATNGDAGRLYAMELEIDAGVPAFDAGGAGGGSGGGAGGGSAGGGAGGGFSGAGGGGGGGGDDAQTSSGCGCTAAVAQTTFVLLALLWFVRSRRR